MTEISNININEKLKEKIRNAELEVLPKILQEYSDAVDAICRFCELMEGLHNESDYEFLGRRMDFLHEEVLELAEGIANKDDVEILDGAIDVAFVALGQAYHVLKKNGHSFYSAKNATRTALLEVCRTNLTKMLPKDRGSKIKKPENWEVPNLKALLKPSTKQDIK